jgi:ABC-type bacteriocin/lantibiotic exporter with double-glycine peptidase domain
MPRNLYRYIWEVSARHQIWLSALAVAIFVLDLAPLELQRRIVNGAIERRAFRLLLLLSLGYAAVVLALGALKFALNVYRGTVTETANKHLRLRAIATCAPETCGEPSRQGVQISIILAEVESVGGFVGTSISDPILHGGVLLSVFGYMLFLQPWMALVAFLLFCPQFIFVPLMQAAINRRTATRIRILRKIGTTLIGAGKVEDEAAEPRAAYQQRIATVYDLNLQIYRRKYGMNFLMNLLHHLGTVGILLAGGWLVVQGRTEVGTVVAFISGLNRVNDPWGDLVNYFRDMTNARVKYGLIAAALGERASAEGSIKPERSRLGADFTA